MPDKDDLMLVGSLDQPLPAKDSDVAEAVKRIDEKIKESIETKNVYIALNAAKQLIVAGQIASWGLARILYCLESKWEVFDIEDDFDTFAYEYIGRHPHTVDRYIKVEKMFVDGNVPKEFEDELRHHNIGTVIPIAHAISQGYEITKKQWKKLVAAPDYNTVSKIIREDVKNVPPRSIALQLYIDREGSIWAFQDEQRYFVGRLNITSEEKSVKQAIERIINNSGMMKQ